MARDRHVQSSWASDHLSRIISQFPARYGKPVNLDGTTGVTPKESHQPSDMRSLDRFGILLGGKGGRPKRSQRGSSLAARPSSSADADALRAGLGLRLVGALRAFGE